MAVDLRPTVPDPATASSTDLRRCQAAARSPEAAGPRDRRVDGALDLKKKAQIFSFKTRSTKIYNIYRQKDDRERIRHLDLIEKLTRDSLAANALNEQSRDM